MPSTRTKVIFFDMDGTLFDIDHSIRHALSAIRDKYNALAEKTVEELIEQYNAALQQSHNAYLNKVITYEEEDTQKVHLFFASFGLPEPSLEQVQQFHDTYKLVYRANRRATAGSVEALVRLRENGYRIGIITDGQAQDQREKAEAIGVLHLIDHIITSEEVGYRKPDRQIFERAIAQLGMNSFENTYMIGDSADSDIKGALDVRLTGILYSPTAQDSQRLLFGRTITVIKHMAQLLGHLNINSPRFIPRFVPAPGQLMVMGIGIDMITEPQRCLHMSKVVSHLLAKGMGAVLDSLARKPRTQAVSHIERLIRAIAHAAGPNDEETTQSSSGRGLSVLATATYRCNIFERDHSTRVEYVQLTLYAAGGDGTALRRIVTLLQGHYNDLMRDDPEAAIGQLRNAIQILAELEGPRSGSPRESSPKLESGTMPESEPMPESGIKLESSPKPESSLKLESSPKLESGTVPESEPKPESGDSSRLVDT